MYKNVPTDNAMNIPSTNSFVPVSKSPSNIPKGVNIENNIINLTNVDFSMFALVNETP